MLRVILLTRVVDELYRKEGAMSSVREMDMGSGPFFVEKYDVFRYFFFFLILEEMLVTIDYDVGYVFVIYDFYYVDISSFHDHFLESFFFYHK